MDNGRLNSRSGELPASKTLYEYFWESSSDKRRWMPWAKLVPEYVHDRVKKFNEILVPTVDTVRTTWLLQLQASVTP